jgi:predicted GNAT superfamily acetyltransferase
MWIEMEIRPLSKEDSPSLWKINEEGLPGTGKVSEDEIKSLLDYSELSIGAFDGDILHGFVICLPPGTEYASLNYAWFNQRYDDFLYVDRIAVSQNHRNKNVGTLLYSEVISLSAQNQVPIAAEVNLTPPNPGSIRFHERNGFTDVGVFSHGDKAVIMLLRPNSQV